MAMTCPCRGHNPGSIPGVGVPNVKLSIQRPKQGVFEKENY